MGVSANTLRAGRAVIEMGLSTDQVGPGLQKLQAKMRAFGDQTAKVGKILAGIGSIAAVPIAASLKTFSDMGGQFADMSSRTGLSAAALSTLKFAAEQTGTSLEAVEKAAVKMQKSGLDPNSFFSVARSIASIEDPTARAQAAFKAWGKSGGMLLPMIGDLDALSAKAKAMGLVWDESMVSRADALGDAFDLLKSQMVAVGNVIASTLAPYITNFSTRISALVPMVIDWIKQNSAIVVGIGELAAKLTLGGIALVALGKTLGIAAGAVKALSAALVFLNANPLVGIATLLGGITVAALAYNGALDGMVAWLGKVAMGSNSAGGAIDQMAKSLDKAAAATKNLTLEERIADKHKQMMESAAMPKTLAKLRGEMAELEKSKAIFDKARAERSPASAAQRRADATTLFNNFKAKLPGRFQAAISGDKLPPEVERAFESLGRAVANVSNALAAPSLDVTDAIMRLKELNAAGSPLEEARTRTSPAWTFDSRLSRQMFGGGDNRTEEEQLKVQKQMLNELKHKRGGLPVV